MLDVDTKDSVIGEGCILQKCKIYHSVVGLRSCISEGVVIEDTLLMGADYYEVFSNYIHLEFEFLTKLNNIFENRTRWTRKL